ncbi:thiaminase II [Rubrobacter indicoceani]|uniref:thiaminase II n=1 Tax=Rubrobacter indicoceani TaxID=2051957 RepID=UPI001F09768E|nr:thiaminase II [Rubrobacter indicoceani]
MSGLAFGGRSGFTGELWDGMGGIFGEILDHPFLKGLTDGTLSKERFGHYVVQDALYLREYARTLALVGVRSGNEDTLLMFAQHSAGAITVERSLHEGFLPELGLSRAEVDATPMSPTTLAYTSYMMKTSATGDYPEGLCAVLPCYWIYAEVGNALKESGSPDPMYARWIETYGEEDFNALVEAVLDTADRACENLDAEGKAAAGKAFVTASRYEWMFWDAGWRREKWPV